MGKTAESSLVTLTNIKTANQSCGFRFRVKNRKFRLGSANCSLLVFTGLQSACWLSLERMWLSLEPMWLGPYEIRMWLTLELATHWSTMNVIMVSLPASHKYCLLAIAMITCPVSNSYWDREQLYNIFFLLWFNIWFNEESNSFW